MAKTLLPPMSEPLTPEYHADSFLHVFTSMDRKKRKEKRKILAYLLDAYAVANFNWEDKANGQNRTLDDADKLKFLADHISKDLLGFEFDHYSLEEMYSHPVVKDEKPEDRVKALKDRAQQYSRCEMHLRASAALRYARQIVEFYHMLQKRNASTLWVKVVAALEKESATELNNLK